jgi:probable rRNA maturation factor
MILVEADAGEEWDSRTDWAAVAERAVRAAVEASDRGTLVGSALAVEISVKFTSDDEIQALNAAYRNKDKATNVLSFPMIEAELLDSMAGADGGELLLGDIALAHGVCVSEAQEKGIEVAAHATHLVVHGTLHLLGYDHETGEGDAERMEEVERKALAGLGIADPYATTEVQSQLDA